MFLMNPRCAGTGDASRRQSCAWVVNLEAPSHQEEEGGSNALVLSVVFHRDLGGGGQGLAGEDDAAGHFGVG